MDLPDPVFDRLRAEVDSTFFPEGRRPSPTCTGTSGFAYDARIEIDMIARRSS